MERLCDLTDLTEGEMLKVERPGGAAVTVALVDGAVRVFPDTCPHAEESLAEGWIEDGRIVCGVHFAEFDADGTPHNGPTGCPRLRYLPHAVEGGAVLADLSGLEAAA